MNYLFYIRRKQAQKDEMIFCHLFIGLIMFENVSSCFFFPVFLSHCSKSPSCQCNSSHCLIHYARCFQRVVRLWRMELYRNSLLVLVLFYLFVCCVTFFFYFTCLFVFSSKSLFLKQMFCLLLLLLAQSSGYVINVFPVNYEIK